MIKVAGTSNLKWLMCSAGVLALASPAIAQTTESSAQPQGQSNAAPAMAGTAGAQQPGNGYSSDIIVTAQRRSERLIDTPQSVTAITSEDLSRLNAVKFVDFANTVPNLQFVSQGVGRTQINIRGVTTGTDVSSTVGIYVDDVPYGSSTRFAFGNQATLDAGLFDLNRVEVLRGPQGTLYGASSVGGLIKYVTTAPVLDRFEGQVQAGVSDTRHGGINYNGNAVINIPIVSDKVALRASGYYSKDGGYIDNIQRGRKDVDSGEVYGARVDLLLKPTDELSIRLTGFGQNVRREGALYADYDRATRRPVAGSLEQANPLAEPFSSDFRLVSGTINYDFGGTELTSITSYQIGKTDVVQDLSDLFAPAFAFVGAAAVGTSTNVETKRFTQEVRLSGTGKTIDWTVGGFYTDEDSSYLTSYPIYDASLNVIPFNYYTASLPSTYREYAAFGNMTLHITDKFDVTGGVRYAHNKIGSSQNGSGFVGVVEPRSTSSEGVFTYLANARYKFSTNVVAYARFATGYRPGGPNLGVRNPQTGALSGPASLQSDQLNSYEAGIKAETADRKFAVDFSAFYIDWKNIQLGSIAGGVVAYINAGGARIKGAELVLTARPDPGFTVTGAFSYNDGELTEASAPLGASKGERLPNTPHFTAAINADYVLNSSSLKPRVGATLRFVGDRTSSFNGSFGEPNYRLPDYVSTDLRAGFTLAPVDVQVFVRNVFDTRGQLSATTLTGAGNGQAAVAIMQPRTIGISLTTRF